MHLKLFRSSASVPFQGAVLYVRLVSELIVDTSYMVHINATRLFTHIAQLVELSSFFYYIHFEKERKVRGKTRVKHDDVLFLQMNSEFYPEPGKRQSPAIELNNSRLLLVKETMRSVRVLNFQEHETALLLQTRLRSAQGNMDVHT